MKIREIINSLEAEKNQLKEENKKLTEGNFILRTENLNLMKENKRLCAEIESLKEQIIEKQVDKTENVIDDQVTDSISELFEKPKRSRKKKVEHVEEVENA